MRVTAERLVGPDWPLTGRTAELSVIEAALSAAALPESYFPTKCWRSRLFSWQMYSNSSCPGAHVAVVTTVHGFV